MRSLNPDWHLPTSGIVNMATSQLCIPVMDSSELVVVDLKALPEEPEDLLEILAAEAAPLGTWFDFARAYLAQGKEQAFIHICQEGTREEVINEVERFFGQKPIYEQIQFNVGLAALHIAKAREEKDRQRKADHFSAATKYLNSAKLLDANEQLVHLAQGLLHLAKGETSNARQELSRAVALQNNQQPNIVAHLALAAVNYNQKQYKEALALYRRALREHPGCPAEVRLGIAACQFRLGDLRSAQAAYERVMALDPLNADAHLGLAVIKFNSPNVQQGLADGLKLLVRAYELDPTNVAVLSMLAHYSLLKGDFSKAQVLARSALEASESDMLRAECFTLLARALHALGSYQEAANYYAQASRLDASAPLPHLGLAQMYLAQGKDSGAIVNASSELESALKSAPAFYDALKILGQLIQDNPAKVEKTIGHFRDAAAKQDDDADIWELLAELLSATDPAGSLKAYQKALDIHRHKQADVERHRQEVREARQQRMAAAAGEDNLFGSDDEDEDDPTARIPDHHIPARLLNNAAVLLYRTRKVQDAMTLMGEANAALTREQEAQPGAGAVGYNVTLSYNMARLQEACGNFKDATAGYKAILDTSPDYIDCYLRLACIARQKGAVSQAHKWASKALDLEGGHLDALALSSQLYMDRRDYKAANDAINKLLELAAKGKDSYGQLAKGNLNLAMAPVDRRKDEDAKKADKLLAKAAEEFQKILRSEPGNVYAANGLGAVLAEIGRLEEAREVFTEVQAAVASSNSFLYIPDLYINLANVSLAKLEYSNAVRLYQHAMEKLDSSKHSQVLLYLARAHYDSGDLQAAKQCLLHAIHIAPTDYKLRFNVALTMQEWAVRVYRKKRPANDPTKLSEYQAAYSELEQAQRYFQHLSDKGKEATQLDPGKLKAHLTFCKDQAEKAAAYIAAARQEADEAAARRENQEKLRALAEAKRKLEELKREEEQRRAGEEQERLAREALERQERLKEQWRLKRGEVEGADEEEGGSGGGTEGKKSRKKRKKDATAAAATSEDGEMAADDEEMLARAGLASDEDEEAGAGGGKQRGDKDKKKKKKRKLQRREARGGVQQPKGEDGAADIPAELVDAMDTTEGEAEPGSGGRRRLQKRARSSDRDERDGMPAAEGRSGDEGAAGMEDIEDEDEENPAAFLEDLEDVGEPDASTPARRARRGALEDSDEEAIPDTFPTAGIAANEPAEAAAEGQQQATSQAVGQNVDEIDALFGNDDE